MVFISQKERGLDMKMRVSKVVRIGCMSLVAAASLYIGIPIFQDEIVQAANITLSKEGEQKLIDKAKCSVMSQIVIKDYTDGCPSMASCSKISCGSTHVANVINTQILFPDGTKENIKNYTEDVLVLTDAQLKDIQEHSKCENGGKITTERTYENCALGSTCYIIKCGNKEIAKTSGTAIFYNDGTQGNLSNSGGTSSGGTNILDKADPNNNLNNTLLPSIGALESNTGVEKEEDKEGFRRNPSGEVKTDINLTGQGVFTNYENGVSVCRYTLPEDTTDANKGDSYVDGEDEPGWVITALTDMVMALLTGLIGFVSGQICDATSSVGLGFIAQLYIFAKPINVTTSPGLMSVTGIVQWICLISIIFGILYYGYKYLTANQMEFVDPIKMVFRFFLAMLLVYWAPFFLQDIININNILVNAISSFDVTMGTGSATVQAVIPMAFASFVENSIGDASWMGLIEALVILIVIILCFIPLANLIVWWYIRLIKIFIYTAISPIFFAQFCIGGKKPFDFIMNFTREVFSQFFVVVGIYVIGTFIGEIPTLLTKEMGAGVLGMGIALYAALSFIKELPDMAGDLFDGQVKGPDPQEVSAGAKRLGKKVGVGAAIGAIGATALGVKAAGGLAKAGASMAPKAISGAAKGAIGGFRALRSGYKTMKNPESRAQLGQDIKQRGQDMKQGMSDVRAKAWGSTKDGFARGGKAIISGYNQVMNDPKGTAKNVANAGGKAAEAIGKGVVVGSGKALEGLGNVAKEGSKKAYEGVKSGIKNAAENPEKIANKIGNASDKLNNAGQKVAKGALAGAAMASAAYSVLGSSGVGKKPPSAYSAKKGERGRDKVLAAFDKKFGSYANGGEEKGNESGKEKEEKFPNIERKSPDINVVVMDKDEAKAMFEDLLGKSDVPPVGDERGDEGSNNPFPKKPKK